MCANSTAGQAAIVGGLTIVNPLLGAAYGAYTMYQQQREAEKFNNRLSKNAALEAQNQYADLRTQTFEDVGSAAEAAFQEDIEGQRLAASAEVSAVEAGADGGNSIEALQREFARVQARKRFFTQENARIRTLQRGRAAQGVASQARNIVTQGAIRRTSNYAIPIIQGATGAIQGYQQYRQSIPRT